MSTDELFNTNFFFAFDNLQEIRELNQCALSLKLDKN